MNRKWMYAKYAAKRWWYRLLCEKTKISTPQRQDSKIKKVCGRPVLSDAQANAVIAEKIASGKPFCLIRPGNDEFSLVNRWDEHLFFGTDRYKSIDQYHEIDGDLDESLAKRWVETFQQDLGEADIFAYFSKSAFMELYLVDAYCKEPELIRLSQIETLWMEDSWLRQLAGKRVLFISPFAEQMRVQYEKRDLIWGGKSVLPDMTCRFVKSVWYMGKEDNSGFSNWFEALDYLYAEACKEEFDIALLGCGPFSSFLAARFKRDGRQAIHYGGALQLLFGIRGARWDDMEKYSRYYNDYWIRPEKDNAPKAVQALDEGCYW